jgi:hypothetical protein
MYPLWRACTPEAGGLPNKYHDFSRTIGGNYLVVLLCSLVPLRHSLTCAILHFTLHSYYLIYYGRLVLLILSWLVLGGKVGVL